MHCKPASLVATFPHPMLCAQAVLADKTDMPETANGSGSPASGNRAPARQEGQPGARPFDSWLDQQRPASPLLDSSLPLSSSSGSQLSGAGDGPSGNASLPAGISAVTGRPQVGASVQVAAGPPCCSSRLLYCNAAWSARSGAAVIIHAQAEYPGRRQCSRDLCAHCLVLPSALHCSAKSMPTPFIAMTLCSECCTHCPRADSPAWSQP